MPLSETELSLKVPFIWCKPWVLLVYLIRCLCAWVLYWLLLFMSDVCFWEFAKEYFIWYALKTLKTASYWSACLDDGHLYLIHMVFILISWILRRLIVCSKVQRKWVSIWHTCLVDGFPLVRSFQLLTFNFCLG
jgi:hypothetical protein